jgi:hypothetical protein
VAALSGGGESRFRGIDFGLQCAFIHYLPKPIQRVAGLLFAVANYPATRCAIDGIGNLVQSPFGFGHQFFE